MPTPANPYAQYLGSRDALSALADTPDRIRALVDALTPAQFTRSHAPGKWTAEQILIHLAHVELAFSCRVRFALTDPAYVAKPFDQDRWVAAEQRTDAPTAHAAYQALRRMNLALFRSLGPEDRARTFEHPERGTVTVSWCMELLAGHEINHLAHLQAIASV